MDNKIANINNNSEDIYSSIRSSVINAQNRVYSAVNSAMVIAYWEIGEQIYKACGENDRAECPAPWRQRRFGPLVLLL